MDDQVFADGIGTISMIGGTVRLDFHAYSPTESDASGQPKPVFRQRIIMGLDAFIATAAKIHEAAETLAARTARADAVRPDAAPAQSEAAAPPRPALVVTEPPAAHPEPPKPPVKPPFP